MAAVGIIKEILGEINKMVSDFEQLVKDAITTLQSVGSRIATDVSTTSKEIFTAVRQKMSSAIQSFKTWIDSKKFSAGSPGTSSSTFKTRVDNVLRTLIKDLQDMFNAFKKGFKNILTDVENGIRDIESKLTPIAKDVTTVVETAGKDFLRSLKLIAENTEALLQKGGTALVHSLEADASFVKNHGLQFAEAATIALINPYVIGSFILSAGFIYAGAMYKNDSPPEPEQINQ